MLSSLAPARRRLLLAVLAVALVAIVVGVALGVLARAPAVVPVAQDEPGPVLLVPGYGGNTSEVDKLAATLRAQGRDVTVVAMPDNGTGDLRRQAQVLDAAARAAAERTGADSVDVVGHSAGGVVARLWVREEGGDALARRVVTLGSPHHGTTIAALASDFTADGCPAGCRQLAPDSGLLRRLNAGDETPRGPVFVSIWTTVDDVVTPPASARLDGALDLPVQSVCPDSVVPHGLLPSDPQVQALIVAELGPGEATTPTRCPAVAAAP